MSQYPSPYQFPQPQYPNAYGQAYGADPLAPAKRASLLMIIFGALLILLGVCVGAVGQVMHSTQLPPELASQVNQYESQSGMSVTTLFVGIAVFVVIVAIVMIVLGIWVRGGRLPAIIISMVVASLTILVLTIQLISGLVQAVRMGQPAGFAGLCFIAIPFALSILLIIWLISAAKNVSTVTAMKNQYAAQYWQHQQAMQQYGGGYGYAPPVVQQQPPVIPPPMPQNPDEPPVV